MEKRKVSVLVGGQPCSFYTDDTEEYISALAERANAVMHETAQFSGASAWNNALLSVLSLTDTLLRTEQKLQAAQDIPADAVDRSAGKGAAGRETPEKKPAAPGKKAVKSASGDYGQVSVWDLLN